MSTKKWILTECLSPYSLYMNGLATYKEDLGIRLKKAKPFPCHAKGQRYRHKKHKMIKITGNGFADRAIMIIFANQTT